MCIVFAVPFLILGLLSPVANPVISALWGGYEGAAQTVAARADGCTAYASSPCSYVAARTGDIKAVGSPWRVTVERAGHTIEFTDKQGGSRTSVIRPGDHVTAESGLSWSADPNVPITSSFVRVGSNTVSPDRS